VRRLSLSRGGEEGEEGMEDRSPFFFLLSPKKEGEGPLSPKNLAGVRRGFPPPLRILRHASQRFAFPPLSLF